MNTARIVPNNFAIVVYLMRLLPSFNWQDGWTYTSFSPCTSSAVHSLHSNTLTGVECYCILDAYVPGYPLIEIHLTMNWQNECDGSANLHRK